MKAKILSSGINYNGLLINQFKVIEMTRFAAWIVGFGVLDENMRFDCLDCHTNEDIKGLVYYIPVLNDTMALDTFKEWVSNATHYIEDGQIEYHNYKRYIDMISKFESRYDEEKRSKKLKSNFDVE